MNGASLHDKIPSFCIGDPAFNNQMKSFYANKDSHRDDNKANKHRRNQSFGHSAQPVNGSNHI